MVELTNTFLKEELSKDPDFLSTAKPFVKMIYEDRYQYALGTLITAREALNKLLDAMETMEFIQKVLEEKPDNPEKGETNE